MIGQVYKLILIKDHTEKVMDRFRQMQLSLNSRWCILCALFDMLLGYIACKKGLGYTSLWTRENFFSKKKSHIFISNEKKNKISSPKGIMHLVPLIFITP